MSTPAKTQAMQALIEAHAIELKLPTVRRRFRTLAEEALREQQTLLAYLAALLEAEMTERSERRERRRLIEARFPVLSAWRTSASAITRRSPATIAALAEGSWIDDRESVILLGESGTQTMLATALAVCACQQGRRAFHHPRRLSYGGGPPPQGCCRSATRRGLGQRVAKEASKLETKGFPGQRAPRSREPPRASRVVAPTRAPARRAGRLGYLALPEGAGARLPGHLRAQRARLADRDHQPAVRRVDQGVPRPPPGQGRRRPHHSPRPHHRDRLRVMALPPRTATQKARGHPMTHRRPRAALALRASLRCEVAVNRTRTSIRDHLHTPPTNTGWSHLKRPHRGHCKRPRRAVGLRWWARFATLTTASMRLRS